MIKSSLQKVPDETGNIKKLPDPSKIKDAKELNEKLTTFSNEVNLNTEVILGTIKGSCLQTNSTHFRSENNKNEKNIEFRQSKAIMAYINKFEKLCFVGNLLCIKEHSEDPHIEYLKICVPLSLFVKVFSLGHCELSGHVGLDKTLANIKRFFTGLVFTSG